MAKIDIEQERKTLRSIGPCNFKQGNLESSLWEGDIWAKIWGNEGINYVDIWGKEAYIRKQITCIYCKKYKSSEVEECLASS